MRRSWTLAAVVAAALIASAAANRGIEDDIPKECPTIDATDKTIHLAHEWDCTKFYKCDHGKRVLFQCPLMNNKGSRLHFDPVLQVCNWPDVVGCISGPTPTTSKGTDLPTTTKIKATSKPTTHITSTEYSTESTRKHTTVTLTTGQSTEPPTGRTTLTSEIPTKPTSEKPWTNDSTKLTSSRWTTIYPSSSTVTPTSREPSTEHFTDATTEWWTTKHQSTKSTTEKLSTNISSADSSGTPTKPTYPPTGTTPSSKPPTKPTKAPTGTTPSWNETESTPLPTDDVGQNSTPIPSGNLVPHESNCSLFYEIVNGTKVLRECPRGLHFSLTEEICMLPSEAGCESTTPSITSTIDPEPGSCGNIGNGWIVPHECVCSKYYLCSNGDLILQECHQGLHYSPIFMSCVDPEVAGCESTTSTTVATAVTTVEIPTECPPDNSGPPVQLPHPTNCSLFYKCDNGKKVLLQCPKDLHFSPVLQMCDWADSAGCQVKPSSVAGGETSTKPTSMGSDGTTVSTSTIGVPTECPPDNSGEAVQLPHPYNCSLYYKCDNGEKVVHTCPFGLEFNAEKQICDWPGSAGCVVSSIGTTQDTTRPPSSTIEDTPSSTTQRTTGPPSSTIQDTTGPPSSTTQYTTGPPTSTTQDTTWPPSSTPKDTAIAPSSTSRDTTGPPISTTQACEEGSKKPDPSNCSFYYACEDDRYVLKECTDGLHFNPVLNICDWWEYAGCNQTTLITSSTTELPASPQITTDDYVGENTKPGSAMTPSSTASTTTKLHSTTTRPTGLPQCIGTCPKRDPTSYTVLLTNEDCTKFCKCSNGRAYVYDCPARLHFSPTKFVCDYPRRAKCTGEGGWGQSNIEVIPAFN